MTALLARGCLFFLDEMRWNRFRSTAGHTSSPANNLILDAVIEFSVDQRPVTALAESEALHDQPSVGMICEN